MTTYESTQLLLTVDEACGRLHISRPILYELIHSGAILMLSPQGKVTRYIYGVSFVPADLQMAVVEAAKGETRPSVNQLIQFCFSMNPSGRGYLFLVTKVIAILTFLLAGGFLAYLFLGRKRSEGKS